MSFYFNPACISQNLGCDLKCRQCESPLLLADRYRTLRQIASGRFGKTYLAVEESKPERSQRAIEKFSRDIFPGQYSPQPVRKLTSN